MSRERLYIVFDGPPGPDSCRFVEVENQHGASVKAGEWTQCAQSPFWQLGPFYRQPQREEVVWVAVTNTDLTEGRGAAKAHAVCEAKATAIRRGKGASVQGCNAELVESVAIRDSRSPTGWLVPGSIEHPSKEDQAAQKAVDARKEAIRAARDAGLTDEQIKALCWPLPMTPL